MFALKNDSTQIQQNHAIIQQEKNHITKTVVRDSRVHASALLASQYTNLSFGFHK